jgi:hypothetical protein
MRIEIYKIISDMLDNPDEHGIYPTSTAYTRLELLIIEKVLHGLGWCYSYNCVLLDKGLDPRTEEVPKLIEAAQRDGILAGTPKEVADE